MLPHAIWDYKARGENSIWGSTIFGVSWAYDVISGNNSFTNFTSEVGNFNGAADFGNFNAGYTGVYSNVPESVQFRLTGFGDVSKLHDGSDNGNNRGSQQRLKEIFLRRGPVGDQTRDFQFNKKGMNKAKREREWGR